MCSGPEYAALCKARSCKIPLHLSHRCWEGTRQGVTPVTHDVGSDRKHLVCLDLEVNVLKENRSCHTPPVLGHTRVLPYYFLRADLRHLSPDFFRSPRFQFGRLFLVCSCLLYIPSSRVPVFSKPVARISSLQQFKKTSTTDRTGP